MKITTSKFIRFLALTAGKGVLENKEALIKAVDGGLEVLTVDGGRIFSVRGYMFFNGNDLDSLGVGDIGQLRALLNNFNSEEEITIKKNANKLVITSADKKLQVEYILRSPEYITNTIEQEKLDGLLAKANINEFGLSLDNIKKMLTYFSTIGNSEVDIYLSGKAGTKLLNFYINKNENSLKTILDIEEEIKKDFDIRISSQLMAILSTVFGEVKIALNNDLPAVVSYISTDSAFNFIYLLAPKKK